MEIAGRKLPGGSRWHRETTAGQPRPAAGYGLTRHEGGPEAIFPAPLPVCCPPSFQDSVSRPPTPEETARLDGGPGDDAPLVVAFDPDAGGRAAVSRPVAAEGPEVSQGFVPGPPRAGAQAAPGPRDWPGPPLPTD